MQLLHVTVFWFRLAGNIFFDLFLYPHIKLRVGYFAFSNLNLFLVVIMSKGKPTPLWPSGFA